MYAKFISRTAIQPFTGRVLRTDERTYVNPTAETLAANRYFPVESEDALSSAEHSDTVYCFRENRIIATSVLRDTEEQI